MQRAHKLAACKIKAIHLDFSDGGQLSRGTDCPMDRVDKRALRHSALLQVILSHPPRFFWRWSTLPWDRLSYGQGGQKGPSALLQVIHATSQNAKIFVHPVLWTNGSEMYGATKISSAVTSLRPQDMRWMCGVDSGLSIGQSGQNIFLNIYLCGR